MERQNMFCLYEFVYILVSPTPHRGDARYIFLDTLCQKAGLLYITSSSSSCQLFGDTPLFPMSSEHHCIVLELGIHSTASHSAGRDW